MDYLEDFDFTLYYHPVKANVAVDAFSRKSFVAWLTIHELEWMDKIS